MRMLSGGKTGISAGPQKQRGAYAVEVAIALIISMIGSVVYWQGKADDNRAKDLTSAGQQLVQLNNAVQTYLSQGYSKILNNQPITKPAGGSVANVLAPTLQDLKDLGFLTPTFSATPIYGGGYQISLSKVPAGCTVPNCDVQSVVNFSQPIYKSGTTSPDEAGAGLIVQQIGANGGRTSSATPAVITGLGAGWTMPSPVSQAGVVAIRGGYNSSAYGVFFRLDGTSVMGGDANIGGNNVNNVNNLNAANLNATGAITANAATVSGLLSAGSVKAGTGQFTGALTASTLSTSSDITAGGNVTAAGNVKGQTVEGGKLLIDDVVTEGSSCSAYPSGTIAKDANGLILSCQSGSWAKQSKSSYSDSFSGGYIPTSGGCITPTASRTYTLNLSADSMVSANLYTSNLETSTGASNASAYSCVLIDGMPCSANVTPGPGHSAAASSACISRLSKGTHSISFQGYYTTQLISFNGTLVIWPL